LNLVPKTSQINSTHARQGISILRSKDRMSKPREVVNIIVACEKVKMTH